MSVEALEKQLEDAAFFIKRRDMALKLSENHEFRKLILEEFCVNECARYARESANPILKPEERADALAMAQAAGHLKRFLSVIVQMGDAAIRERQAIDEALVEARAEEDAGE